MRELAPSFRALLEESVHEVWSDVAPRPGSCVRRWQWRPGRSAGGPSLGLVQDRHERFGVREGDVMTGLGNRVQRAPWRAWCVSSAEFRISRRSREPTTTATGPGYKQHAQPVEGLHHVLLYPGPVAVVVGSRERRLMRNSAELTHRALPGSTLHTVPEAGHDVPFTHPEALVSILHEAQARAAS